MTEDTRKIGELRIKPDTEGGIELGRFLKLLDAIRDKGLVLMEKTDDGEFVIRYTDLTDEERGE